MCLGDVIFCADISLLLRGKDIFFCESISRWELSGRILKNFLPKACRLHKKRSRTIRVGRDEKDRTSRASFWHVAFGTRCKHQRCYSTILIISAHNACNVHQCRVLEFTYLVIRVAHLQLYTAKTRSPGRVDNANGAAFHEIKVAWGTLIAISAEKSRQARS